MHLFLARPGNGPEMETRIIEMMCIPTNIHVADVITVPREYNRPVQFENIFQQNSPYP
jgi:hypothetical protein